MTDHVVYEGAVWGGAAGGPSRHFAGMAEALSRSTSYLTCVLPAGSSSIRTLQHVGVELKIVKVPTIPVFRDLLYDLRKCFVFLRLKKAASGKTVLISRYTTINIALIVARLRGFLVVLEINGPPAEEILANFKSPILAACVEGSLRLQLRCAHVVRCVSPGLREYIVERRIRVADEVQTIANGARDPHVAKSRTATNTVDGIQIVFAGAFTPWYELDTVLRGLRVLIDAYGVNNARLSLVGDGPRALELKELTIELELQRYVNFTGWLDHEQSACFIQSADIALVPLAHKGAGDVVGSPLKLYEYIAARKIIVASNVDGIRGIVVDSIVKYAVGSPVALAAALADCVNRLDVLSRSAREVPRHIWSWEARAELLLEMIGGSSVNGHGGT